MNEVDIGVLEQTDSWKLSSIYFPSKVGGKPAWLDLKEVPDSDRLRCIQCGKLMQFLCQIYAPIEDFDYCFHRTLYIFICLTRTCLQNFSGKSLMVLRCQLPLVNPFYPDHQIDMTEEEFRCFHLNKFSNLCEICNLKCNNVCKLCSKCHCKDDHVSCSDCYEFEEYEIVINSENECSKMNDSESKLNSEYTSKLFKKYSLETNKELNDNIAEFEEMFTAEYDKVFERFHKRISLEPHQVIRYNRDGSPLPVTRMEMINIPACDYCHGPRIFEFQVMPQLLYYLKNDELDWGTIIIYTCKKSCDVSVSYKNEFAFVQNFTKTD